MFKALLKDKAFLINFIFLGTVQLMYWILGGLVLKQFFSTFTLLDKALSLYIKAQG